MRLLKKYFNRENKFSLKERFNMVMTVVTCFFMGVMSENGRGMQGIKGLIDEIGGLAVRMNGWLSSSENNSLIYSIRSSCHQR